MSGFNGSGLHPIYLRKQTCVDRGIKVACPVCREAPGKPCKIENGEPAVHDARESLAFHGKKIWI